MMSRARQNSRTAAAGAEFIPYDIGKPYEPGSIGKELDRSIGAPRSLLSFVPSETVTDILNGVYIGDLWPSVDSALDSGEDIILPMAGRMKITDRLDFARQGQRMSGASLSVVGGFQFLIDQDFNMAAPHVLAGAPFTHVENVFLQFYQPPGATTKAGLIQYPWAMSARAAQRSTWKNIGWGSAWNGFDGRGIDAVNHPGGLLIDGVLDGAMNFGGQFQDAFDFIKIDAWHGWEYGYNGNAGLAQINYSEPKYLVFGQNLESLDVGRLSLWMMTLNSQGSSLFKKTFDKVKLDGWASKLEWQAGEGIISALDITCDKNTPHNLIEVSGGDLVASAMKLYDANAHNAPMIKCSAGRFRASGGKIESTANGWHSEASGSGVIDITGVVSKTGGNAARTLPFHKQTGATSRLLLANCEPDVRGTGSGDFVVTEASAGGSGVRGCDYKGYNHNGVGNVGNGFAANLNVGNSGSFSMVASDWRSKRTVASLAEDIIAEFYLGDTYTGATIEVSTAALIQGVGLGTARSIITIVREGGAALSAPTVTALVAGTSGLSHTAVVVGNNVQVKALFTAASPSSVLTHHVAVDGDNVLVRK
jgi:hypothetical protein